MTRSIEPLIVVQSRNLLKAAKGKTARKLQVTTHPTMSTPGRVPAPSAATPGPQPAATPAPVQPASKTAARQDAPKTAQKTDVRRSCMIEVDFILLLIVVCRPRSLSDPSTPTCKARPPLVLLPPKHRSLQVNMIDIY